MDGSENTPKKNLPRLNREAYQGTAVVHWVFNIKNRKRGWLDDDFFLKFQLIALHAFSRYRIISPCICLMPDHIHFLLMGISDSSDQKLAIPFLRKQLKPLLTQDYALQKTPYDHVLRRGQRTRIEFSKMVNYIRGNPARSGLLRSEEESWPYECCLIPGYPELSLRQDDFRERFWRIYYYVLEKDPS
ncbi:hypothetical protein VSU19_13740 [Verrucomicrobiales bacterium BCK34]|nr:hypothetical protein [Verrucomicrobiales bacterium BCK34]